MGTDSLLRIDSLERIDSFVGIDSQWRIDSGAVIPFQISISLSRNRFPIFWESTQPYSVSVRRVIVKIQVAACVRYGADGRTACLARRATVLGLGGAAASRIGIWPSMPSMSRHIVRPPAAEASPFVRCEGPSIYDLHGMFGLF